MVCLMFYRPPGEKRSTWLRRINGQMIHGYNEALYMDDKPTYVIDLVISDI